MKQLTDRVYEHRICVQVQGTLLDEIIKYNENFEVKRDLPIKRNWTLVEEGQETISN